jgi:indole-3-glycerol phosphate synthase
MSHLARLVAQSVADAHARRSLPLPVAPALRKVPRTGLIAEVKRASPSRGAINPGLDPAQLAQAYERGGAGLVSVLTERQSFGGSLEDLRAARAAIALPVLRKDFLVEEFQIREARAHGADAVLLIAAAAEAPLLRDLRLLARELGLTVLFEVHEAGELDAAALCEPDLLGINARDLKTLEVRHDTFEKLAPLARGIAPLVAESGVKTAADARRYRELGAAMLLVGEALSSAADPAAAARALVAASGGHGEGGA